MFDVGSTELLLVAIVGLLVIGPKELPNTLRTIGRFTGKARAMSRHVRSGFDEMMRQAEIEEMEKQWREHNARIMAETPSMATDAAGDTAGDAAPDTKTDAGPDPDPGTGQTPS